MPHTATPSLQKLIAGLSRTFPRLEELSVEQEYDNGSPRLDFTDLSFPCLTSLELTHTPLATLEFNTRNTPRLRDLNVDQPVSGIRGAPSAGRNPS